MIEATMLQSTTTLEATAVSVVATSEDTKLHTRAAALSIKEATQSATSIATAVEELNQSAGEILGQVERSERDSKEGQQEVERADTSIHQLVELIEAIELTVGLISQIAAQTNLLALNATIEAARAGETDRGFSIVASEVKLLASQTARATETVSQSINRIRGAAGLAIDDLKRIENRITLMSESSTSISSAVAQQHATLSEINRSAHLSAGHADALSSKMDSIARGAQCAADAVTELGSLATKLAGQSHQLKQEVATLSKRVSATLT